MTGMQLLVAHGSGIDEVLVFVVPVVALLLIQRAGKRRRRRAESADDP
jgi:hypothetical protein